MWQFLGYRKALFWYDLVWQDCEKLKRDLRGRAVAQQLIRSAGSISANVEGGHGRRAIAFILISCPFVILSDRRERRISISPRKEEILRRFAPQNDSLEQRISISPRKEEILRRFAPQNDSLERLKI